MSVRKNYRTSMPLKSSTIIIMRIQKYNNVTSIYEHDTH